MKNLLANAFSRRRPKPKNTATTGPRFRASFEALEQRELMTAGVFLQGTAFVDNANNGMLTKGDQRLPGVQVQLIDSSNHLVGTATTDANGQYLFDDTHNVTSGNLQPGTYTLQEVMPTGYVSSSVQVESQLNPGFQLSPSTAQVTVVDPTNLQATFDANQYFSQNLWELTNPDPNASSSTPGQGNNLTLNGQPPNGTAGQFPLSINGGPTFQSLCTDLTQTLDNGVNTFQVIPSETPISDSLTTYNAGRIAYLYNHYGTTPLANADQAMGLAVAVYALEYDATPNLSTGNLRFSSTDAAVLSAANFYLTDSVGQSETATFLHATTSTNWTGLQSQITTGSINFCNTPTPPKPSINVVKTADAPSIVAGQTAGFTVTITNNGTVTDSGVTLTDPLPPGSGNDVNWHIDTSGTGLGAGTTPTDFQITGSVGSQSLSLSSSFVSSLSDSLAPGQSISVHITGLTSASDAGGSTNTALGAAGNYTVLYEGTGGHNLQVTNVTINGNVGVGGTGKVQFSGPGTIAGRLDFSAASSGQFSNNNGSNVGPTSVNYNVAAVTTALNTVSTLNHSLAGLGNKLTINGNQTINASAGQLDTVNGVTYRVFNVTSYSENDGKLLTINGDGSGDPVVFNFGYNSNVNLGGDVALTGGLTPDQVLWNFTSSGKNISLNNNASSYRTLAFQGIILAPNDAISVVNSNLIGRVFGGNSSDMQIVSGDTITAPPSQGKLVNTATVCANGVSAQQATATIAVGSANSQALVDSMLGQLEPGYDLFA